MCCAFTSVTSPTERSCPAPSGGVRSAGSDRPSCLPTCGTTPGSPPPCRPKRPSSSSIATLIAWCPRLRRRGGEVLKYMGDGLLAIFRERGDDRSSAVQSALTAGVQALAHLEAANDAGRFPIV